MEPTKQYTVNHADSDGTTFKLPGDQPGSAPFDLETNESRQWHWYVHVENGWDQNADFTVEGSHIQDAATGDTLPN